MYSLVQQGSESASLFHLFHLFIDWSNLWVFFGVGLFVGVVCLVVFVCFSMLLTNL